MPADSDAQRVIAGKIQKCCNKKTRRHRRVLIDQIGCS
jgi:hypothetical protein